MSLMTMGIGSSSPGGLWTPAQSLQGVNADLWLKADRGIYTGGARQFSRSNLTALKGVANLIHPGSGNFSVEAMVYLDSTTSNNGTVIKSIAAGIGDFMLMHTGSTSWRFYYWENAGVDLDGVHVFNYTITTSRWYHLVVTVSAGTVKLYVNGVEVTESSRSNTSAGYGNEVAIGSGTHVDTPSNNMPYHFDGRITKVRYYHGNVLTQSEITWLFNSGRGRVHGELGEAGTDGVNLITKMTVNGASWNLNESNGTDAALDAHGVKDLVVTNGELVANPGFETVTQTFGARGFNGTTQYFEGTDNATLEMGDVDCWFAGWVKLDSKTAQRTILGKYDAGSSQREYHLLYDNGSDRFRLVISNDGSAAGIVNDAVLGSPSVGTWYFVMAYHDAVSNQIGISINGGAFTTATWSTGLFAGTAKFIVGGFLNSGTPTGLMAGSLTRLAIGKSPPAGIAGLATTIRDALYANGKGVLNVWLTSTQRTDWGMIAFWPCTETSTGTLNENLANINLTAINAPTAAPDMFPQADFGTWVESLTAGLIFDHTSSPDAGSHSLGIYKGPVVGFSNVSQPILTVGHRYVGVARVKGDSAGAGRFFMQFGNASYQPSITTSYATYTSPITTATSTASFYLYGGTSLVNESIYIDSVSVKAVDILPANGPGEMTVNDSVGTNDGVLTNMSIANAWSSDVPSVFGGDGFSMLFDGVDDRVTITDATSSLSNMAQLSFGCWIKQSSFAPGNIFYKGANTYRISLEGTGKVIVALATDNNAWGFVYNPVGQIIVNQWNHIFFTYSSGRAKVYINGVQVGSTVTSFTGDVVSSGGSLTIGSLDAASPFPGNVDDVRVYNTELSQSQITELAAGNEATGATPLSHWSFDEGPPSDVVDGDTVLGWESQEGSRHIFVQDTFSKRPIWRASAINGKPGIQFDGLDDLLVKASAFLTGLEGTIVLVCSSTTTGGSVFSMADEASGTRYMYIVPRYTGGGGTRLCIVQANADTADVVQGSTTVNNAAHCHIIASNSSVYSLRVDGNDETENLLAGVNSGDWFDDIAGKDSVVLGGLKRTNEAIPFGGIITEVIVYPVNLILPSLATLSQYINRDYNLNA